MSGTSLGAIIRALLSSNTNLHISPTGHAAHAQRYLSKDGKPIGFEPGRVRFQNIWVRADSIVPKDLAGIAQRFYDVAHFGDSKPNHDLFGENAFKGVDLICFKVRTAWEAARVIAAVTGLV